MAEVKIYGASDDLVEIGGDIYDEFNPADTDDFLLAFSDGTVLRGKYDGVWRFVRHSTGSAAMEKVEAPEDDDDNYSDVVTLNGEIAWVVLGSAIAKP